MAEAKIQFERLNNFNWASWKFRMELLLVKDGLHEVVNEPKPDKLPADWLTRDGKARATIGLALDNDQLCHVMGAVTSYDMWEALKGYHERGSLTNKVYVFRKLCSLKLEEGGNMSDHLMEVAELVHRLVALGEGLQEHWIVAIILSSLPGSYDALITALESRPVEELKQDYVKGKLLDEWKRKSENGERNGDSDKALQISTRGRNDFYGSRVKSDNRNFSDKKKKCYCCQKLGHFWRDCPRLSVSDDDDDDEEEEAKVSVQRKSTKGNGNIYFNAFGRERNNSAKQPKKEAWCLDSGCMMHLTGRADLLDGLVDCREEIILADGRKILATATGTGRLKVATENGEHQVIPIKGVLFVPGLAGNLLSVSRIAGNGFNVVFNSKECRIMKEDSVIVVGKKNGGLYVVQ